MDITTILCLIPTIFYINGMILMTKLNIKSIYTIMRWVSYLSGVEYGKI